MIDQLVLFQSPGECYQAYDAILKRGVGAAGGKLTLMHLLAERLNFTLDLTWGGTDWGSLQPDGITWAGITGKVMRGEADLSPCTFTPIPERFPVVDWSRRWDVDVIGFYVVRNSQASESSSALMNHVTQISLPLDRVEYYFSILSLLPLLVMWIMFKGKPTSWVSSIWTFFAGYVTGLLKQVSQQMAIFERMSLSHKFLLPFWLTGCLLLTILYGSSMVTTLTLIDHQSLDNWPSVLNAAVAKRITLHIIGQSVIGVRMRNLLALMGYGQSIQLDSCACSGDVPTCIGGLIQFVRRKHRRQTSVSVLPHMVYNFNKLVFILAALKSRGFVGGYTLSMSPTGQSLATSLDGMIFTKNSSIREVLDPYIAWSYDTGLMRYLWFQAEQEVRLASHLMSGEGYGKDESRKKLPFEPIHLNMLYNLGYVYMLGCLIGFLSAVYVWKTRRKKICIK